jgi:AcrR family transcriptional regulator
VTAADPGADARPRRRTRLSGPERELQLLDIAEQLFAEHGYEGVTIEDIARAAGVTRPIIYQHHGSKDGIFIACVRRARAEFEAALTRRGAAAAAAGGGLPEAIAAGGAAFFEFIDTNPRRWALLFSTSASYGGYLAEQLTDLRFSTVERIVALGRKLLPETSEETLQIAAHGVSGMAEQLGRWWLRNPEVSVETVTARFAVAATAVARELLAEDARIRAAR